MEYSIECFFISKVVQGTPNSVVWNSNHAVGAIDMRIDGIITSEGEECSGGGGTVELPLFRFQF